MPRAFVGRRRMAARTHNSPGSLFYAKSVSLSSSSRALTSFLSFPGSPPTPLSSPSSSLCAFPVDLLPPGPSLSVRCSVSPNLSRSSARGRDGSLLSSALASPRPAPSPARGSVLDACASGGRRPEGGVESRNRPGCATAPASLSSSGPVQRICLFTARGPRRFFSVGKSETPVENPGEGKEEDGRTDAHEETQPAGEEEVSRAERQREEEGGTEKPEELPVEEKKEENRARLSEETGENNNFPGDASSPVASEEAGCEASSASASPLPPQCVDGGDLDRERLQAVIRRVYVHSNAHLAAAHAEPSVWCTDTASGGEAERETKRPDELPPWFQYPDPNTMWPNPLLHNHRLKPFVRPRPSLGAGVDEEQSSERRRGAGEAEAAALEDKQLRVNKHRLEHLWKFARSYGVAWDELDEVYIHFMQMKRTREERWEEHRTDLLQYAAVVAAREVREKRKKEIAEAGVDLAAVQPEHREQMCLPRSLHRKETRRLFFEWRRSYLGPWRPGGLQKLMKAVVTLRMLQRETNERFLFLGDAKSKTREEREEARARMEAEIIGLLQRSDAATGTGSCAGEVENTAAPGQETGQLFEVWEFDGVGKKETIVRDEEEDFDDAQVDVRT
ncbi:conserved hypothetical protein [Neospora caninum Liverpool]|uniref:Chromosome III, complete sequence, related n=1 Tax=Neospora caninum (strain Liverpool) TaxID=572307 RepID=F0VCS0_NEOCL|nr:conserved hypothetical protein [Neospora caninum Liverpool]CBZ51435.1 conserved hypothetical protein [Neospora caninum Liverpool]|eukprot:XP_003881468.1 conserved hypothetical protein [Neospora caninum Liverpool]